MDMTVITIRLALLLAPILLMGEKIPRNKGGHFPFCKSQLDSQTFGMAGPMRLWPRYHHKEIRKFESVRLNQMREYQLDLFYSKVLESDSTLI